MASAMIKNQLIESSSFYIFGAGSIAMKVKNVLQSEGKIITSFIVSSKSSRQQINGIQVKVLTQSSKFDKNTPVIIAVFNREPNAFLVDIIIKLKAFGFSQIITYPEFHSFFPTQLGDDYWLTDKIFYSDNIKKYNEVLSLFNDQTSKENYSQIIEYLKTFDPFILGKYNSQNQYFPLDIDVWNGKGALYDIGSYDGENIYDAFLIKGQLELVIAFEPDLINYNRIVNNQKLKNIARQFFIYPCGVWSETTMLRFKSDGGESSSQSEDGNHIIPVVKIDEVIHTRPGYLKMDIEGAEVEALIGAKETIFEFRPSLAISLYHRPNHFFTIPLLVNSWNLGYKFYIRFYANNLFETVLYCIQ
jgi:FkbM family methyltransferase